MSYEHPVETHESATSTAKKVTGGSVASVFRSEEAKVAIRDLNKANLVMVEVFKGEAANLLKLGHVRLTTFRGGADGFGYCIDFRPSLSDKVKIIWEKDKAGGSALNVPHAKVFLYGLNVDAINLAWKNWQDKIKWGIINRASTTVTAGAGSDAKTGETTTSLTLNSASLCGILLVCGGMDRVYGSDCSISLLKDISNLIVTVGEIAALISLALPSGGIPELVITIRNMLVTTSGVYSCIKALVAAFNDIPKETVTSEQLQEFVHSLLKNVGDILQQKFLSLSAPFVTTPEAIEEIVLKARRKQNNPDIFRITGELAERVTTVGHEEKIPEEPSACLTM